MYDYSVIEKLMACTGIIAISSVIGCFIRYMNTAYEPVKSKPRHQPPKRKKQKADPVQRSAHVKATVLKLQAPVETVMEDNIEHDDVRIPDCCMHSPIDFSSVNRGKEFEIVIDSYNYISDLFTETFYVDGTGLIDKVKKLQTLSPSEFAMIDRSIVSMLYEIGAARNKFNHGKIRRMTNLPLYVHQCREVAAHLEGMGNSNFSSKYMLGRAV